MIRWGLALLLLSLPAAAAGLPVIRIGSKNFTESYILAEILAQTIEAGGGARVERRLGMGGTGILHTALRHGEIDVYPEYTGTLNVAIFKGAKERPLSELRALLEPLGLKITEPLGINNSYGLAMARPRAAKLGISKMSDLKGHPGLRMAFSYEFMERKDGYRAMVRHYGLKPSAPAVRMDHALVYSALSEGKADVIEVYTTDAKIEKLDLAVLQDDRGFFPAYEGAYLYREAALAGWPGLARALERLAGTLTNADMINLNALVELKNFTYADAARSFIEQKEVAAPSGSQFPAVLYRHTKRHFLLVAVSTLAAILLGVPLGILAAKHRQLGQSVLLASGLIQTIPSLALLCFLIPVFGIGIVPTIVALILYGLLPIVRGTYSGIKAIEPRHLEVARVLGLTPWQRLLRIEAPLASLHILSGIKTAAIINVGMATLAAFIGAGGYGALIVTGLSLNDNTIILQGALPAAAMALAVHFVFELLDRILLPKGLRY